LSSGEPGVVGAERRAYPRGVPEQDYAPLLVILQEHLSERNLSAVVAELIDGETVVVANDAAAVMGDRRPRPDDVERVKTFLEAHGWPQEGQDLPD